MPTNITIKNIPEDLYAQLKKSAEANHRSINSEIITCIEMKVRSVKINPDTFIERARQLREKTATHPISDIDFTQAKGSGRL
jgi:plasmid stability protein